jgi:integration host factor subunit beta
MTTTKKDIALEIAKATGCNQSLASQMVDSLFQTIRENLIKGDRVEIRGFGVFQVKDTLPRTAARNPRTGEPVSIPARRKIFFRPGKLLKTSLDKPRWGTRTVSGEISPLED